MEQARLEVKKTCKLYVGGAFVRSESGRVAPACDPQGRVLDNYSLASRKDLRDAATAARNAFESWAGKTAYLRGQILYRAAEMLEQRKGELAGELERGGQTRNRAQAETRAAIERLIYYAGWTDKYAQVFGSVNPVASPHFNFTTPEPMGVVAILAPEECPLVGMVSLAAAAILSGNTCVVFTSERTPLPGLTFAEIAATSDLPAGVLNILSGRLNDLAPHLASHMDINAIVDGAGRADLSAKLDLGSSFNLKRVVHRRLEPGEWLADKAEDPHWILDTVEFKTAWHPIGT